jgi:hypothetical protein
MHPQSLSLTQLPSPFAVLHNHCIFNSIMQGFAYNKISITVSKKQFSQSPGKSFTNYIQISENIKTDHRI